MKDWIVSVLGYILSNWQSLVIGGVVVLGVVIFLMGIIKKLLINKVKNKLLRKVILAWLSVILVFPVTAISVLYNGFHPDYFWVWYGFNCVAMIVVYWLYENTAIRNSLAFLGKKIVIKFLEDPTAENAKTVMKDANKDAKALLQSNKFPSYKDDDLDNI